MKKFLSVTLAASLLLAMPAYAASAAAVNGQALQADALAYNEAGNRAYIALPEAEALFGVPVAFAGNRATVEKNGHSVVFEAGKSQFIWDGLSRRALDSEGLLLKDGAAYLPLRALSEATASVVSWTPDGGTDITTNALSVPAAAAPYLENVQVLDQSTVRIAEGETVIYIDPYSIEGTPHDADIILIAHTHDDHLDVQSIKNLMNDDTVVYVPADGVEKVQSAGVKKVVSVMPGEEYTENGVNFKAVHAYNLPNELETRMYHPKENNWVGYVVTANGIKYYAAGDTDYVPELEGLQTDVAFIPVDGVFNMNETEAAAMANAIAPKVAVPYHYVNYGTEAQAVSFISMLDDGVAGVLLAYKLY